jgi:ABC-type multidrug transport system fused ATPase/permease subunit
VDFHYPGAEAPVLCDVDLTARPREVTAVIGSTGSGKTTLLNLVPRLFDADRGQVLVDGVDVRELDPALLSRTVGLVPQKPYLFTGTVASNLRYGNPDATDEELWRALEVAQARDFVERMEAAWTRRSPRAARTSRAASGSGSRSPGCSCPARDLPLRRLVLGARLRHRRGAAGRR